MHNSNQKVKLKKNKEFKYLNSQTWSKLCSAALRSSGFGLRAAWSITARLGRSISKKICDSIQGSNSKLSIWNQNR